MEQRQSQECELRPGSMEHSRILLYLFLIKNMFGDFRGVDNKGVPLYVLTLMTLLIDVHVASFHGRVIVWQCASSPVVESYVY